MLEINGQDISNSTTKEVVSLLKNLQEPKQFVLLRIGPFNTQDIQDGTDTADEGTLERLQRLNATLNEQIEMQMSETQHWRDQYEQ